MWAVCSDSCPASLTETRGGRSELLGLQGINLLRCWVREWGDSLMLQGKVEWGVSLRCQLGMCVSVRGRVPERFQHFLSSGAQSRHGPVSVMAWGIAARLTPFLFRCSQLPSQLPFNRWENSQRDKMGRDMAPNGPQVFPFLIGALSRKPIASQQALRGRVASRNSLKTDEPSGYVMAVSPHMC